MAVSISVHVQMSPGCGHGQQTVALLRGVLAERAPDARLEIVVVRTAEEAERLRFRGSPTVLVDGADIEPHPPAGVGFG
jgi:anti-sigma factor ChrR (cupin superfamily)